MTTVITYVYWSQCILIHGLPKSYGDTIDYEDKDVDTDRMNAVEKVKPLAPLRALTSNIVDPEYHVLDVELHLDIDWSIRDPMYKLK